MESFENLNDFLKKEKLKKAQITGFVPFAGDVDESVTCLPQGACYDIYLDKVTGKVEVEKIPKKYAQSLIKELNGLKD